ncbi:chorismate-binding protein [Mangrovimonas sp. YM274]|uniref:chorismate-binding protein n=1 Tax=Mangrovimonas sp. YM274 TaxID=3070660 RepID=UPI0027DB0E8D|nr:chorismate-binding protein [Mangrovimonas sp. YM274]WMI67527.1 chorismate-binding protein [Mangrovimonas sp. YM274]
MDLDAFLTPFQDFYKSQRPFVLYRKPYKKSIKGLVQKDDDLHFVKDFSEQGFVMAPFDDKDPIVLIPFHNSEVFELEAYNVKDFEEGEYLSVSTNFEKNKKQHVDLVNEGVNAIQKGAFEKVVLSRLEKVDLDALNPIELFRRLLAKYPTAFTYCWYHPKIGLWLGATPETLLKVENNRMSTMALAGTQAYKDSEDVVWGVKEQQEQQFVTDFIVESLHGVMENLRVTKPATVRAGGLLHIQTKISGTLNGNLEEVIKRLHPTPAVCGLPKLASKTFIIEKEHYNRTYYTGFLGELNVKEKNTRNTRRRNIENNAYDTVKTVSDLYVNLRCMQLESDAALIYVGGGITKDSNPELEWEETVNKSKTMKRVLYSIQ